MDDLLDMISADTSPSEISDKIKDMLYSKASERVDAFKPVVANSMFAQDEDSSEEETPSEE